MKKFLNWLVVPTGRMSRLMAVVAVLALVIPSLVFQPVASESAEPGETAESSQNCPFNGCGYGNPYSCTIYNFNCGQEVCIKEGCKFPLMDPDYGYYCISVNFACTGWPYGCCDYDL